MLRFSRLVLGALVLNLSFAGQTLPCAHEVPVVETISPGDHAGPAAHAGHDASEKPEPCDDAEARCCEAIASCSMSAVASRGSPAGTDEMPGMTASAGASFRPRSLLLEVATPPPRG